MIRSETRKVQESRTGQLFDLCYLDKEWESSQLGSGQVPKVLSVDAILKASLAILQMILIGLMAWVLNTVVEHSSRITRNETVIQQWQNRDAELINFIHDVADRQQSMINSLSTFQADIGYIKQSLKDLQEKNK